MRRAALLLALLIAWPAAAQDAEMKWALAGYGVVSAVDRATTAHCLGAGTCREVGALRFAADHPGAYAAVGASIDLGIGYVLAKWSKEHPKAALAVTLAITAVKVGIVVRNSRELERVRRLR